MTRVPSLVRSVVVTTPPTDEPIELADAKLHLKVEVDDDDSLIQLQITAARQHIETECELALMPQKWTEYRSTFPPVIELRGGVVQSIVAVKYVDSSGDTQTLDESAYQADLTTRPATIRPAFGQSWPACRPQPASVSVEYSAGYQDADAVPGALKAALLLVLGDLYANRSGQAGTQIFQNATVDLLLRPWRRVLP